MPRLGKRNNSDRTKEEAQRNIKKAGQIYLAHEKHRSEKKLAAPEANQRLKVQELMQYRDIVLEFQDASQIEDQDGRVLWWEYDRYITRGRGIMESLPNDALSKKTESLTAEQDEINDEKWNQPVTDEQAKGLRRIGAWMLKHELDKSQSQEYFVSMILSLPDRARLFMYYLVENDRQGSFGIGDIIASQEASYVPDLDKFRKKNLWGKTWNKLEQSLSAARSAVPVLEGIASLGLLDTQKDDTASASPSAGLATAGADNQKGGNKGGGTQPKKRSSTDDLGDLSERRMASARQMLRLSAQIQRKQNEANLSGKKKKKELDAEIASLQNEFMDNYTRCYTINSVIGTKLTSMQGQEGVEEFQQQDAAFQENAGKVMGFSNADEQANIQNVKEARVSTTQEAFDLSGQILGPTDVVGSLGDKKVLDTFKWNMPEIHQNRLEIAGKVLSGVAMVTAVADGVFKIIEITQLVKAGKLSFTQAMSITENLFDVATDVTQIVTSAMDIAEKLPDSGAPGLSVATGGITLIKGSYHMGQATRMRKNVGEAVGNIQSNDNISEEDKTTVGNIGALSERIAKDKQLSAGAEMISGALTATGGILTLSGVGSGVGMILSFAASAVSLGNTIRHYFAKRKNAIATIDEYIDINSIVIMVSNGLLNRGYLNLVPKTDKDIENVKTQIRDEIQAALGFASRDSFYQYITGKYAEFLFAKTFLGEDGKFIKKTESEKIKKAAPYAAIVDSICPHKLIYADDEKGTGIRPSVDDIAQALQM